MGCPLVVVFDVCRWSHSNPGGIAEVSPCSVAGNGKEVGMGGGFVRQGH